MGEAKLGENCAREWREEPRAPQLWDALQLVESDPPAGMEMLERLAENGSPLAKMYLGDIHLKGKHGLPEDRAAGEHWLRQSAEDGSVEGAYGWAWHLLNTGQTDDALNWYDRLAELGYSPALYALGAQYYTGRIVEQNLKKALHYFLRGEELGHFYAANWACRMRIRGHLGPGGRLLGLTKIIALFGPFMRTVWNHPNSDRLRI